jgi:anti-sigma B factor antagonist
MALAESGPMSRLFRVDYGNGRTFVFLSGEHDLSTSAALRHVMAEAIARNDADLIVDLSDVDFMGATTVGVIVRAREFLQRHSRTLVVGASSRRARHVLELCGLLDIFED